eukprot:CAMPEP_0173191604 /NCGR_PEP_ID=MMETSP1141-20130122/12977_1 /TAXON_ID=483371 /ORGANISM="non described non described, Strain CCMP2298" /LENGTH=76 /DNA_ID=CAMNT_0014115811 /DNA_START=277 /DNA_END=507 /DNA_ORIENTATION=-
MWPAYFSVWNRTEELLRAIPGLAAAPAAAFASASVPFAEPVSASSARLMRFLICLAVIQKGASRVPAINRTGQATP